MKKKTEIGLDTPNFRCLTGGHHGTASGKEFRHTHERSPDAKTVNTVTTGYYERIGWSVVCSDGCQWNFT